MESSSCPPHQGGGPVLDMLVKAIILAFMKLRSRLLRKETGKLCMPLFMVCFKNAVTDSRTFLVLFQD